MQGRDLQDADHFSHDPILEIEDPVEAAVDLEGFHDLSALHVHTLHRNADHIPLALEASPYDPVHSELTTESQVVLLASIITLHLQGLDHLVSADQTQRRHFFQIDRDCLGDTGAQPIDLGITREIDKVRNSDGAFELLTGPADLT